MALRPIQELTLACDVLQVLEETARLMDKNNGLFKARDEESFEKALQSKITTLSRLRDRTNISDESISMQPDAGRTIVAAGHKTSLEFIKALEKLRHSNPQLTWIDFVEVLRKTAKRTEQQVLVGIVVLYSPLMSRIRHLGRTAMQEIRKCIRNIQEGDMMLGLKNAADLREIKSAEKLLKKSFGIFNEINTIGDKDPEAEVKEIIQAQVNSHWLHGFQSQLEQMRWDIVKVERTRRVLRSLHFENMHNRRQKITRAHAETFDWIFEKPSPQSTSSQFLEWLRGSPGTPFWIKGKAGSGKSTLMKFLSSHEEVTKHLKPWAGRRAIITASFFFWNSGTPLQKSQMGLLRSLLFEILSQCPELISSVSKIRLAYQNSKFKLRPEDSDHSNSEESEGSDSEEPDEFPPKEALKREGEWSREELLFVFKRLYRQKAPANFCFFIDGLDEYKTEGRQNHQDLFETIRALAASPNVKLCISSRPWADLGDVFNNVFGKDDTWTLRLEDLTKEDIHRYVHDVFMENHHYTKLTEISSGYSDLIKEIVERANGVFLWVFLVVQELLVGLTYHETLSTMRRRLDAFPEDLEQYFQRMIDMVPAFDREKSAQTFRIAMSRDEPLFMMTYAFMDELSETPRLQHDDYVPYLALTPQKILELQNTMMRRLDGRCRGLIEVVTYHDANDFSKYRVDFLHRTVRDYLVRSADANELFLKESEDDCQLFIDLCRAICLCLYHTQSGSRRVRHDRQPMPKWLRHVWDELFHFAYRALKDEKNDHRVNEILDDAEISRITAAYEYLDTDEVMLTTACRYGLVKRVRRKLPSINISSELMNDLLQAALSPNRFSGDLNPELVDYLLTQGANPNKSAIGQSLEEGSTEDKEDKTEDKNDEESSENDAVQVSQPTTFTWFIGCIVDGQLSSKTEGVLKVLWLLLRNGANLNATVVPSPRKVIDRHFTSTQVEYLLSAARDCSSRTNKHDPPEMLHEADPSKKVGKRKKNKFGDSTSRRCKKAKKQS